MRKILRAMDTEVRPDGKCVVKVLLEFDRGVEIPLAQAVAHRVCAELLEENLSMKDTIGVQFQGVIRVDTQSFDAPETGVVVMEAMGDSDIEAAQLLAGFVHDNTELMD